MAWDSVPWFIGGGAQHSPEVARLLAYAATGGAEGIVGTADLKVTALPVPGASIRVAPGAALIRNRATGGDSQTYAARLPIADTVGVASTGAGAGRSDLVVAQIEDPFMAGEPWQTPADPKVGPYIHTRIIPNVPAGTTRLQDVPGYSGRSAITLARIDFPASTGTVTAAMIKDLRVVGNPRSKRVLLASIPPSTTLGNSNGAWVTFPAYTPPVEVPSWASFATVYARLEAVQHSAVLAGEWRVRLGDSFVSAPRSFDLESDDYAQTDMGVIGADKLGALSGKTATLKVEGRRTAGPGELRVLPGTQLIYDVYFEERAV